MLALNKQFLDSTDEIITLKKDQSYSQIIINQMKEEVRLKQFIGIHVVCLPASPTTQEEQEVYVTTPR